MVWMLQDVGTKADKILINISYFEFLAGCDSPFLTISCDFICNAYPAAAIKSEQCYFPAKLNFIPEGSPLECNG